MPWISLADYTQLVKDNAAAQVLITEIDRLRGELAKTQAKLDAEIARNREREDAEIARNREREDCLVDRVITSKGAYAVSAPKERKAKSAPSQAPLTAFEEAELKMYVDSAIEQGFGPEVGRRMFERDRQIKLNPQADLSAYNDLPVIRELEEIDEDEENANANKSEIEAMA